MSMKDELNNAYDDENIEETENALEEGDLIELIDDSGKKTAFIFVDALEYEDSVYLALADQEEDDAVFFLKIDQDEDGNDVYTAPDESLEDILFRRFTELRENDN